MTGAATPLSHRLGVVDAIILGAITGIGGGMLRDVLVREIPTVLRGGLYAIPALTGAGIVVTAYHAGDHTIVFPIVGATVCFAMRMAGLRYWPRTPKSSPGGDPARDWSAPQANRPEQVAVPIILKQTMDVVPGPSATTP